MTPEYIMRKSLCRAPFCSGPYELRSVAVKHWPAEAREFWQKSALRQIENTSYAAEYAERGYDNPKKGILFSDWNLFPKGLDDLLERYGYAIEWEDEWDTCANCGKAFRSQADSYGWQPSYISNAETGERFCHDCFSEDDIASFEDNPRRALNDHIDPAEYGYEKIEGDFESGWYHGQTDNPQEIYDRLVAAGHKRILFVIDSVGQFDLNFSAWKKKVEE